MMFNTRLMILALVMIEIRAFSPTFISHHTRTISSSSSSTTLPMAPKGFGEPPKKKEKSSGQADREAKSAKYDEISASGGQEYNIFVRQFGSDDDSWLPCGSIAVPRGSQVTDAIYANEEGLKTSIVRSFPKLGGYEAEFEYGYNLKVYPDDPVEVAMKGNVKKQGMSVGNWISSVLSPMDASQAKRPE